MQLQLRLKQKKSHTSLATLMVNHSLTLSSQKSRLNDHIKSNAKAFTMLATAEQYRSPAKKTPNSKV
jgi:hypothetical protein